MEAKDIRPKSRKYNHAFTIAFELETNNKGENVTKDELLAALRKRIVDLENNGDEIIEACGAPFDTYEND